MRFTLNFPRAPAAPAAAARASQPKQTSFASRLASNAAPAQTETDPEEITKELVKQYLQQNELMQQIMATPGQLPDRETD